jgi:microcystin-dependent protein
VETVTLTAAQLPAHTHTVLAGSANGESNTPTNNIPAVALGSSYSTGAGLTLVSMSTTSLSSSGGNQPHDNMMQSIAINFIIATQGLYPSQA